MRLNKEDYVKKALLDTQERIRDFMNYSQQVSDEQLSGYFREFAETEGRHAQILQSFVSDM